MAKMATAIPARKVYAGTLGAAIGTILTYVLGLIIGDPVPEVVGGAIITVSTFVMGYYVPPAPVDQVVLDATA